MVAYWLFFVGLHLFTNVLIGTDPASIPPALERLFAGEWKKGSIPPLWDGKACERIVGVLRGMVSAKLG